MRSALGGWAAAAPGFAADVHLDPRAVVGGAVSLDRRVALDLLLLADHLSRTAAAAAAAAARRRRHR